MFEFLSPSAHAEPPRAEVFVGWSGNADHGFGYATFQPALVRVPDASFVLRATVSHLYYSFPDAGAVGRVSSPGTSVGPGFVYTPGDLALGVAVGFGARHGLVEDGVQRAVALDATLSTDAFWRPGQRANVYGQVAFSAADRYLWARAGATVSALPPLARDARVSVWLGGDVTTSGALALGRQIFEAGPVLEVPLRDLNLVVSARAARAYEDRRDGLEAQGWTAGGGIYWSH